VSKRAERRLRALRDRGLNFEPRPVERYTPANGWHADAISQPLPRGSWKVARRLVEAYCMADPALVHATWDHDAPLLGRDMLLKLRLYRVLSVYAGVRVTRVWDETSDGERVFGFEYGTLTGHVERGRMDYEVRERGDGAVDFLIHAHSRPSGEGLPWVRLGFRLFGRREQLRFYARCCERIARLSARELGLPEAPPPPASRLHTADTPDAAELPERLVPRRTAS
jgi:uncharacterized protein (UPF0548 family)